MALVDDRHLTASLELSAERPHRMLGMASRRVMVIIRARDACPVGRFGSTALNT
jgi:hypothetical protein